MKHSILLCCSSSCWAPRPAPPAATPCPAIACAPCPPAEQPVCVETQAVEFGLNGLWMLDSGDGLPVEALTISEQSLYWVEADPGMGDAASAARELYYQILRIRPGCRAPET